MLFATSSAGTLYAFNTAGEAQPVFVNGATSVSTGPHPTEVRGLAFSTLDENLFERTPGARQIIGATPMDVRLGIAPQVGVPIVVDKQQFAGARLATKAPAAFTSAKATSTAHRAVTISRAAPRFGRQQRIQPQGLLRRR